jgi:hypothetical protein
MPAHFKYSFSIPRVVFRSGKFLLFVWGILASPVSGQQIKLNTGAYLKYAGATIVMNGKLDNGGTINNSGTEGLKVTGDFLNAGTFVAGAATHLIGGNWTSTGTFNNTGSTINFNGNSASNIGPCSFNHIIISGTGAKTANGTINASGNFNLTSGQFNLNSASDYNITISGNYTQTGGVFDFNTGTSGNCSMFLGGNFAQTAGAGSMTTSGAGAPNGIIVFNGSGTQTLNVTTPGGAIWVVYSVPSGKTVQLLSDITLNSANGTSQAGFQGEINVNGTFDLGTSTVSQFNGVTGTALFTVNPGANLITANAGGLSGSVSSTNMTRIFSSGANYEFRGASTGTFTTTPSANTVNNLTINNAATVLLTNSLNVAGLLSLLSGNLSIGVNTLTISGVSPVRTNGTLDSSDPGSTITFANSAPITLPVSVFNGNVNNLTVIGAGGITAGFDFTVNGVLNLQSGNPLATKGILDMWDGSVMKTLTMGGSATTAGTGDVTGIVKRNSFIVNTPYSFGNQFTTMNMSPGGTLPSMIEVKVTLTSSDLTWMPNAIHRYYDIIQTGGNSLTRVDLNLHYLDGELNGAADSSLDVFDYDVSGSLLHDNENPGFNGINKWVGITNLSMADISAGFGGKYWTLGPTTLTDYKWLGLTSTNWVTAGNWVRSSIPVSGSHVIIPSADSTTYDPDLPASTTIGYMLIRQGGIVNGGTGTILTLDGGNGTWQNYGSFNAGTNTVLFTNAAATMANQTNFFNVAIANGAKLTLEASSVMKISGALSLSSSGILYASNSNNTVEFNGVDQTVMAPNGVIPGYYNLILSGSGNKTMPVTAMTIAGDFTMSGSASAIAGNSLSIGGGLVLGSGNTFETGAYSHMIGGNLINNGTFTGTGSTVTCNGAAAQSIEGAGEFTFDRLYIDNATGVTLKSDALTTVSGGLLINSGKKFIEAPGKRLTITGTFTNNAGSPGFVMQSGTAGTASLIHNSNDVQATVECYIGGMAEAWHFLSSPVTDQPISGSWLPSGTYGNGTGYDLYVWNEITNCWIYKLNTSSAVNWNSVHPGSDFAIGGGYLYSVQMANPTNDFTGHLNNGPLVFGLTNGSSDVNLKGFNLAGNPYPSSIDWQASSGWSRSGLANSGGGYDMWIWNPSANNYGVFNSATGLGTNSVTGSIAPMQGFFVRASASGNLGMDNEVRFHNGTGMGYKSTETDLDMVSLGVESETDQSFDEVRILFGYSSETGATKLFSSVPEAPGIYMPSGNENYSVRYLTDTADYPLVPVMFKPGVTGNYKIKCNFNDYKFETVMLEDLKTHSFQDMKIEKTYRFNASKSDNANRFILHFGPTGKNAGNTLPAKIFTDGNSLIVDLSLVKKETDVVISDILGRVLLMKKLQGEEFHSLDIEATTQVLLVKLINPDGSFCQKFLWGR